VAYRGYFKEKDARRFADSLEQEGFDVYIGGAIAYSTLGWFDDPILSTFTSLSESDTAALIFHELAHGVLYVPDDTAFNESFATAVEQEGLKRWQANTSDPRAYADWQRKRHRRQKFTALVSDYKKQLEKVYAGSRSASEKRIQKDALFFRMRSEFRSLTSKYHEMAVYSAWFNRPLNNAQLLSVSTYHDWVPAFSQMLSDTGGNLESFYEKCRQLAKKEPQERQRVLTGYLQNRQAAESLQGQPDKD
jgi:predicted aminopeptidase